MTWISGCELRCSQRYGVIPFGNSCPVQGRRRPIPESDSGGLSWKLTGTSERETMEATETPTERLWRSMSDLHIDISEALEAGKTPEAIASDFGISLSLVEGVVEEVGS